MTSLMTSWTHNIWGQISRKLLQIADTFLLGAYRKVARGYRMVTSPITSRDPMTSQSGHHNLQHAISSTVLVGIRPYFWQRVSIACYAERCLSYDRFCLTDRPSVTVRYHAKTTPATIMGSSLEDSPMTLVSSTLDFTAKFQREHGERGRRMREG